MSSKSESWRDQLETVTRPADAIKREMEAESLPCLTILAHPDPARVGEQVVLADLIAGRVAVSRLEPRFAQPRCSRARPLADPGLSRTPWHLNACSDGSCVLEPNAGQTHIDVDGSPLTAARTVTAEEMDRGVVLLLAHRIVLLFNRTEMISRMDAEPIPGLIGESAAMLRVQREIHRVADLDFPVLLRGESGTGKELVARALHQTSSRRGKPYLTVNVAAVPPTLAASELFGASRGAFSGADRNRRGYFQRAQGGTLFLDEIGEIPQDVQALLLRALESGQIQPVGADQPENINVRIISATDRDLEGAIEREGFRLPLLHRLAGYEIILPALRDRREDFGRLFFHSLAEELRQLGESSRLRAAGSDEVPWVDAAIIARLATFTWPGNVRQLRNVVRQLALRCHSGGRMELSGQINQLLERQEPSPLSQPPAKTTEYRGRGNKYRDPDEVEESEVRAALVRHRFEPTPAAKELGLSRPSLYNLMTRYGFRKAADLTRDEILRSRGENDADLSAMAAQLEVSKRGLKIQMKELGLR